MARDTASRIYHKHGLKKGEGRRALGKKFGIELSRFGANKTSLAIPHAGLTARTDDVTLIVGKIL